jgi:hypothetical protein
VCAVRHAPRHAPVCPAPRVQANVCPAAGTPPLPRAHAPLTDRHTPCHAPHTEPRTSCRPALRPVQPSRRHVPRRQKSHGDVSRRQEGEALDALPDTRAPYRALLRVLTPNRRHAIRDTRNSRNNCNSCKRFRTHQATRSLACRPKCTGALGAAHAILGRADTVGRRGGQTRRRRGGPSRRRGGQTRRARRLLRLPQATGLARVPRHASDVYNTGCSRYRASVGGEAACCCCSGYERGRRCGRREGRVMLERRAQELVEHKRTRAQEDERTGGRANIRTRARAETRVNAPTRA